jgi:Transposase IS200 like
MADHVHMLISIPPKYSVAEVIGFLKGKSSIWIAQNVERIALGKARERRIRDESVKPLNEVQPVKVRPGQSPSRQAGSECCLSPGNWRVRSVHSKEAGREGSAPTSLIIATPTPLR